MKQQYISIDLDAITAVRHCCTGCASTDACCCSNFEIYVGAREMKTIIGALPLVAIYCPWLKDADGFDNVFDEVERGSYAIDKRENGLCVFAYRGDSGIRCSLHSVAEQIGISPHQLKPFACTLWPLSLLEPPNAALSICDDAVSFPCVAKHKQKGTAISPEILSSIEQLLGESACRQVKNAAKKGLSRIKVRLCGPLAGES